ncbi:hypothetical protein ACFVXA_28015 [Streptomyces sp. NPDC058246]
MSTRNAWGRTAPPDMLYDGWAPAPKEGTTVFIDGNIGFRRGP